MRILPKLGQRSPATIIHDGKCQEIFVNPFKWITTPKDEREFIIRHELAHCQHNVFDEIEADEIALRRLIAEQKDTNAAISAIRRHVKDPIVREQRIHAIKETLTQQTNNRIDMPVTFGSNYNWFDSQAYTYHDAIINPNGSSGIVPVIGGSPADSSNGGTNTADASGMNANDWLTGVGGLLGGVGGLIGGIKGNVPRGTYNYQPPREENNNAGTVIIIVIAVVAIIGLGVFLLKK